MPQGKKYIDALKRYNRDDEYTPTQACELIKQTASAC
jgi:hypothetical protein